MGNQKRRKREHRESNGIAETLVRENCDGDAGCGALEGRENGEAERIGEAEAVGRGRDVYIGTLVGRGSCLHPSSNNKAK